MLIFLNIQRYTIDITIHKLFAKEQLQRITQLKVELGLHDPDFKLISESIVSCVGVIITPLYFYAIRGRRYNTMKPQHRFWERMHLLPSHNGSSHTKGLLCVPVSPASQ